MFESILVVEIGPNQIVLMSHQRWIPAEYTLCCVLTNTKAAGWGAAIAKKRKK